MVYVFVNVSGDIDVAGLLLYPSDTGDEDVVQSGNVTK